MLYRFRIWLSRLIGSQSVLITIRLRGVDDEIGPYWLAHGDRVDFTDERGWLGTVLAGPPTPERWTKLRADNPN